jgi:hypothetical protein
MSAMPLRAPVHPRLPEVRRATALLPRLRIVRAPSAQRTRAPFILLCVAVLVGALLAALMLNVAMAQSAFTLRDQQVELARLTEQQQKVEQQLGRAASPEVLAGRARALGMVPALAPAFIQLSDGTIIGESGPAARG